MIFFYAMKVAEHENQLPRKTVGIIFLGDAQNLPGHSPGQPGG